MLDFITADIVLINGDYFYYNDDFENGDFQLIHIYLGPKLPSSPLPYSPEIPF